MAGQQQQQLQQQQGIHHAYGAGMMTHDVSDVLHADLLLAQHHMGNMAHLRLQGSVNAANAVPAVPMKHEHRRANHADGLSQSLSSSVESFYTMCGGGVVEKDVGGGGQPVRDDALDSLFDSSSPFLPLGLNLKRSNSFTALLQANSFASASSREHTTDTDTMQMQMHLHNGGRCGSGSDVMEEDVFDMMLSAANDGSFIMDLDDIADGLMVS